MEIKDLENTLGISRANIRFYEKEGLIFPKRKNNGYRDYTQTDLLTLQKIIILRKLGISLEDIKDILNNNIDLQKIIDNQILELSSNIAQLESSLEVCRQIQKDNISIENLDNTYLQDIHKKEEIGLTFEDLTQDYRLFQNTLLNNMFKGVFFINIKPYQEKYGFKISLLIIFLILIVRGIGGVLLYDKSFFVSFFYPILIFTVVSAILLPIFLIAKKHPKLAKILFNAVTLISLVLLGLVFLLLITTFLNSIFHFWY